MVDIKFTDDEFENLLSILHRAYFYSDTHINNNGEHLFDGDRFIKLETMRKKITAVWNKIFKT